MFVVVLYFFKFCFLISSSVLSKIFFISTGMKLPEMEYFFLMKHLFLHHEEKKKNI